MLSVLKLVMRDWRETKKDSPFTFITLSNVKEGASCACCKGPCLPSHFCRLHNKYDYKTEQICQPDYDKSGSISGIVRILKVFNLVYSPPSHWTNNSSFALSTNLQCTRIILHTYALISLTSHKSLDWFAFSRSLLHFR